MNNRRPFDQELMPRIYYCLLFLFTTPLGLHRYVIGHKRYAAVFFGTFWLGLSLANSASMFGETGASIASGIGLVLLIVFLALVVTDFFAYPFAVEAMYKRILDARKVKLLHINSGGTSPAAAPVEPASLYNFMRSDRKSPGEK